jgi:hypothetical protein
LLEERTRLQGDQKTILLCEETMVTRRMVVRERERIIELSTMDFLKLLETEQRIQWADAVFGRQIPKPSGAVFCRLRFSNANSIRYRRTG